MKTESPSKLVISSPVFVEGGAIPTQYTADGEGVNPPLVIDDVPDGTLTMALIMEDPDAPRGTVTHWVLWDINPAGSISEGSEPGLCGLNTTGKTGYLPPNPPSGSHRYYFHVYALDGSLSLRPGSSREELEKAIDGHVLASGTMMGRYEKVKDRQQATQTH
ncbi:MAG TPA: YbhB/YbcL family Raf kinase inhibitor-like protein [Puia sp.]|nr:YbhB/YbcL family Raf kinase inhibitor-like protein [Puia sp.]